MENEIDALHLACVRFRRHELLQCLQPVEGARLGLTRNQDFIGVNRQDITFRVEICRNVNPKGLG